MLIIQYISYPKSKYLNCHKSSDLILKDFYYNEALEQYRPCYKTCKKCSQDGNEEIHNCISCKNGYRLKPFGESRQNCVINCTYYIRNAYEQYKCLSSYPCPEEAPYMIEDKRACIYDCTKDDVYIYLYNGKCVKNCPEEAYLVGNICKVDENKPAVEINTFYSKGCYSRSWEFSGNLF